jgi:lipoprotein-releasing system permease protein
MSYISLVSRRYLRSGRNDGFFSFITLIAILGIMLGTATLIIALSVLGGFEREITEKVVGFTSHVQILGFQNQILPDPEANAALIRRDFPVVTSVSPFVAREALIRSREGVDGIFLKGVDPAHDNSQTRRYMTEGNYSLERVPGGLPPLVIGRKLASRLGVEVGSKVTIFGMGRLAEHGPARVMQFKVAGIYESGMAEYDDVYAFTGLYAAQALFQTGDGVTGYDLLLSQLDSAAAVADGVRDLLGYPHYGRTVYESYRNLFSWIELQKKPVPLILGLIIVVATVNIIGTLLMMVLDKTREIGVLATLGATPWGITRIFVRQGMTIGLIGTGLGNALAFTLCFLQAEFRILSLPSDIYFMSSVPILLRPEYFLLVSAVTLALSFLSSMLPARLASRLRPVSAIRFS